MGNALTPDSSPRSWFIALCLVASGSYGVDFSGRMLTLFVCMFVYLFLRASDFILEALWTFLVLVPNCVP